MEVSTIEIGRHYWEAMLTVDHGVCDTVHKRKYFVGFSLHNMFSWQNIQTEYKAKERYTQSFHSGDREGIMQKYNNHKWDSLNQARTPSPLPTHQCQQSLSTLKAAWRQQVEEGAQCPWHLLEDVCRGICLHHREIENALAGWPERNYTGFPEDW